MAFQVKVEYGGKRFAAFLLENISYGGLVSSCIKKNCSSLAHLHADKIRLRYGYGERLSSRFFFLRSRRKGFVRRKKWKTTTTRKQSFNLKKTDSPCPRKMRRVPLWLGKYRRRTSLFGTQTTVVSCINFSVSKFHWRGVSESHISSKWPART